MLFFLISTPVFAADYITYGESIKDTYKQNEKLEIVGVIFNNKTVTLEVISFNVIIVISELRGRNATVVANVTKELNRNLDVNQSLTAHITIDLRNFLPDKYNITAFFVIRFSGGSEEEAYVFKDKVIRVKPYIEIPPAVMLVLAITVGIIIVFVGYGIAGKFMGRKK